MKGTGLRTCCLPGKLTGSAVRREPSAPGIIADSLFELVGCPRRRLLVCLDPREGRIVERRASAAVVAMQYREPTDPKIGPPVGRANARATAGSVGQSEGAAVGPAAA